MVKESFYFAHDYEPTADPKLQALIGEYGATGYGIFWRIVEMLHADQSHSLPMKPFIFIAIARQMLTSVEQIESIVKYCITTCELFIEKDGFIYSERVNRNIEKRMEISNKRSIAGHIGAEMRKQTQAIAKQTQAKSSKGKERKVKEKKENEISPPFIPSDEYKTTWEQWISYKSNQHKFSYEDSKYERIAFEELLKLSGNSPSVAEQIVNQSIAKGWKGLFALKDQPKPSSDSSYEATMQFLKGMGKNNV